MPEEPGQKLSHYRLIEKIGEGGMGVVWKAEDTVLGRIVAVKVLPADLSVNEQRRKMFLEEARLASSLSHGNIAQVHELGREGDLDFIVMEYVEGKPLNDVLHGRPVPPDTVVALGEQIARALSRAHRGGLIHRDLKPENVLVTADDEVKVVDFGLASLFEPAEATPSLEEPPPERGEIRTEVGIDVGTGRKLVGTLPYLSPEQARMERLDARSDIFSLGAVLYEMTTGHAPFSGPTTPDLLQAIQRARPRPVHELVPGVPVDLEKIIAKALAPRKEDRYQHMEDLAVDLKRLGREMEAGSALSYEDLQKGLAPARRRSRLLGALAVTLALALVAFGGWRIASRGGAKPDPRKLLILPIDVRGQGEGADYVGRAFAESLAVNLAEAGGVHLLPVPAEGELRASGPGASVREAEARGAGRLLTGVLTREGESVHASLSLVDVTENRIVWGVEEVARPEDLRALAPALARKVGAKLGASAPKPYDSPFNLTTREPLLDSPLYSEAVAAVRDQDPSAAAVTGRLVGEFPGEPDAHVLRAFAEWYAAAGYPPGSPRRTALDAALDALDRVDPGSPWDDYLRSVAAQWDGRHPEAVDRTTRILERGDLTPSARAFVLKRRGEQRTIYGDVAAGLDDLEEARRLEPADAEVYTFLSQVLTNEARPEDGLVRARQAAALSPLPKSRRALAWALQNLGRWDEAADAWMETCGSTEVPYMCALAAHALQHAGREPEAREAARRAEAAEPNPWGALWLAHTFAAGGDRAKAIRAFERYLDLNPSPAPDDLSGPDWAAFQGDRRLQDLLEDEWKAAADAWAQDCTAAPTMFTCGMHALALQKVGRQADASEAADRASEMVESAWGHYYLARCRALAGDRTAAVGHLRRYLELRAGGDPRLAGNPDFRRLDGDEEFESILVEIRGPRWVGH